MSKPFDRATQRRILEVAREAYPGSVSAPAPEDFGLDSLPSLLREVTYLEEHGLLTVTEVKFTGLHQLRDMRITAKGIDFLADDGGLGATLGVVTVRLDVASMQALILSEIDASGEPESVKDRLRSQVKSLPAEAVKVLATEGLKAGLRHTPDAVRWLQTVLPGLLS